MAFLKSALLVSLMLALSGCGQQRYEISGTVTVDGEPVADGRISFLQEAGPGGGGPIKNGQYKVMVPAGKSKVMISASKLMKLPDGQKGMDGKTEERRSYIPVRYNDESELTETITASKKLDFPLKSQ